MKIIEGNKSNNIPLSRMYTDIESVPKDAAAVYHLRIPDGIEAWYVPVAKESNNDRQ